MQAVFGIAVSKASSEVAILINSEKVHSYTMPSDAIGFARLLGDLKTVQHPEIIFEATGVAFSLPIKSTPLSGLILATMNLGIFLPSNTSPNVKTLIFCSSVFTISQTSMRNEKDNRR